MKHISIQAEDFLNDKLKKRNTPQMNNMLGEFIETYSTLYSQKEPVGMDSLINKMWWMERREYDQYPKTYSQ